MSVTEDCKSFQVSRMSVWNRLIGKTMDDNLRVGTSCAINSALKAIKEQLMSVAEA